jgi:hypothetical protein
MSDITLGQLTDNVDIRDAVHVAVVSVIADEPLVPGSHVGFSSRNRGHRVSTRSSQLIGVVDPFLMGMVQPGERFWLFVYPQTITGLRHDWSHPAFPSRDDNDWSNDECMGCDH